jgi:hypothetical protein
MAVKLNLEARSSQADFELRLRSLIPAIVNEFPKLESGEPYHFDHWADDTYGSSCPLLLV